ncbi:MAG: 3-phosphoshikimate 1-carboxyvinyltransferase [Thermodesulfobacteriota bacterium]|nr:MAG: 3-phosphoshikimate 1-carboxyvinyltransferase [Thermodesulfobacteriota bacterium]
MDRIKILPAKGLNGEIKVPGDKSVSHRALILGSIAEGETRVEGLLEGADTIATISAFRAMGVGFEKTGDTLIISGMGLSGLREPEDVIDARNSGTTARLLTGLLSGQNFFSVITGDASLRKRPMRRVVEPLQSMGASIFGRKDSSRLPLAISPRTLTGISYRTPVASAQLKSAILLAGLYASGSTSVTESEKSRDHTERMLPLFGAEVKIEGNTVTINRARELSAATITVPGDISSAAFLMVGAVITPESHIVIRDVGVNPTRTGIIRILERMGAKVELLNKKTVSGEPVADISVKSSPLNGVLIKGEELLAAIDEFPVICVAAALSKGRTIISGAAELRVKESDRISAMADALKNLGVSCTEKEDGLVIDGIEKGTFKSASIDCRGDHRVAMSLAVAALRSEEGIEVKGAKAVDVSFPGFFTILEKACRR